MIALDTSDGWRLANPKPGTEVYRLSEVDFEARTITLRALGQRQVSFTAGNYVVLPQSEFVVLRDAAQGMSAGTAKTPQAVEGEARQPGSRSECAQTPPGSDQ